jgi:glucokinase
VTAAARYAAIDLGGTNVRAIVAGLDGNIYSEDIRLSKASDGLDATLGSIVSSLDAACAEAAVQRSELGGLGIASPGAVDAIHGVVPGAPQLPGWNDVPIVEMMSERLGVPVWLENDANAAALGENRFGAGQGTRNMLYMTVSTGVGGGIIIDGSLYRGTRGAAGELGHVIIDLNGPPCGCGGSGCLESLASGTSIARRGRALVEAGDAPRLAALAEDEGKLTAGTIARAAEAGDDVSRTIYEDVGTYLGVALASYVNIFNPEAILIGGGVSRASNLFLPTARRVMEERAMSSPLEDVTLGLAELGDRIGSLGMIARIKQAVEGEG